MEWYCEGDVTLEIDAVLRIRALPIGGRFFFVVLEVGDDDGVLVGLQGT